MKIKPLVFEPLDIDEPTWFLTDNAHNINYEYRIISTGQIRYRLPLHSYFKKYEGDEQSFIDYINAVHVEFVSQFLES